MIYCVKCCVLLSNILLSYFSLIIFKIDSKQVTHHQKMQQKIPLCPKHDKQTIYVCAFQTCKQHRILCQICKQKQTLHFSNHANYIHKFQRIKQFDNAKRTIPQLEKGVVDCQNYVIEHKKFYMQQITAIKEDIALLKREFMMIADKYQEMYASSFQKQIQKFDEEIQNIKKLLRQYTKQKNQQDSFFTLLFQNATSDKSDEFGLEALIKKNAKAFKVRVDIINLKSSIAVSKNNQTLYKKTDEDKRKLTMVHEQLDYFTRALFDKLKDILVADPNGYDNLKASIVTESKTLALSRVSFGNLLQLESDLKRSQVSTNMDKSNLQKVPLPALNPVVASIRDKLKPIQPQKTQNSAIIQFQGPYLYSTGVYFGQFSQNKRQGWGQFVFHNGSIYQGQWDKDMISGFGRLIRNDCLYQGHVKDGRANGSGNYQDMYQSYTGEWKNDKRCGVGTQQWKNKGKKYTGVFMDNKYNGRGKLITEEYVYEGQFKDNLFNGDGIIRYHNGEIFQGSFVEGEKHIGHHSYPDGSYYDGMFKQSLPNGTGEFFWADGIKFSGQWKLGLQDGCGVQTLQDGKQLKGIWKNGKWEKWL